MKFTNQNLFLIENKELLWGDDTQTKYILARLRQHIMEAWLGWDWSIKLLSSNYPSITANDLKIIKVIKSCSSMYKLGDKTKKSNLFWGLLIYENIPNDFSLKVFDGFYPPLPIHMHSIINLNHNNILELLHEIDALNQKQTKLIQQNPRQLRTKKIKKLFRDPKLFIKDSKLIKRYSIKKLASKNHPK